MRQDCSRCALTLLLTLCLIPIGCGEAPPVRVTALVVDRVPEPPSRAMPLSGGRRLTYTYHFDRNALRDSRLTETALFAVTRSGHLLAFDPVSLDLVAESVQRDPAVCLGEGPKDETLVGFESGRYARILDRTLTLEELGKLPGEVRWLARRVRDGKPVLLAVHRTETENARATELPGGRTTSLHLAHMVTGDDGVTCFHLDRAGRLWSGHDFGEWGGGLRCLGRGFDVVLDERFVNVVGFAEAPDGRVFAFGGLEHMGCPESFISSIDTARSESMARFPGYEEEIRPTDEMNPLCLPFSHLEPLADGKGYLAISGYRLFRTDAEFEQWEDLLDLDPLVHRERWNPVGFHETYAGRHRASDGRLILTTRLHGLLEIDATGRNLRRRQVPDQLDRVQFERIRVAGGTAVVGAIPRGGMGRPWMLRDGAWFRHPVFPPKGRDDIPTWPRHSVWPAPDGSTLSFVPVYDEARDPRVTRWRGTTPEAIEAHCVESASNAVVLPDGTPHDAVHWNPEPIPFGSSWLIHHWNGLRAQDGEPVEIRDDKGGILEPTDALQVRGSSLLLATPAGLFTWDGSGEPARETSIALPEKTRITCLARDGSGRLWLAGDGLHVLSGLDDEPCGVELPILLRSREVADLARDPEHPDGVLLAVRNRGLLRLRVSRP